jgi:membrane protein DedA with SNARE-associated domain
MEGFVNQFGYFAVAALIFLENVFPPIPSEVILPLSGFLSTTSSMTLPGVIVSATIGSISGAFVLYGIGRVLSRDRLISFFETRPMRLLGFTGEDIARVVDWFDRRGQVTVLVCRCIPGLRSLISIPAGTAHMGLARFTLYTMVGSLAWNTLLCWLGASAGTAWSQVSANVSYASNIVYIVLAIGVVAFVAWWLVRRAIPVWRESRS